MQGRSFRETAHRALRYAGRAYVFSERNWHDCDEHQRAVRTGRYKLIRTDAYTSASALHRRRHRGEPVVPRSSRAREGRPLTTAQRRLFEAPRARLELYDLAADPWELRTSPTIRRTRRKCASSRPCCRSGSRQSDDFPAAYRVRDDNTDRITGVQFNTRIPPLRNPDVPPRGERWGEPGPR